MLDSNELLYWSQTTGESYPRSSRNSKTLSRSTLLTRLLADNARWVFGLAKVFCRRTAFWCCWCGGM